MWPKMKRKVVNRADDGTALGKVRTPQTMQSSLHSDISSESERRGRKSGSNEDHSDRNENPLSQNETNGTNNLEKDESKLQFNGHKSSSSGESQCRIDGSNDRAEISANNSSEIQVKLEKLKEAFDLGALTEDLYAAARQRLGETVTPALSHVTKKTTVPSSSTKTRDVIYPSSGSCSSALSSEYSINAVPSSDVDLDLESQAAVALTSISQGLEAEGSNPPEVNSNTTRECEISASTFEHEMCSDLENIMEIPFDNSVTPAAAYDVDNMALSSTVGISSGSSGSEAGSNAISSVNTSAFGGFQAATASRQPNRSDDGKQSVNTTSDVTSETLQVGKSGKPSLETEMSKINMEGLERFDELFSLMQDQRNQAVSACQDDDERRDQAANLAMRMVE